MATLLSHYFQPTTDEEVKEAAIDDWIDALVLYSQESIAKACTMYLRNQPSRRPTPAAIRNAAAAITNESKSSDKRANLSPMERQMLDDTVLPNARRSLSIPALAEHGRQTLEYWGESVSHAEDAKSVARYAADRISAGEAVSDVWLYGPIAVEIERSGLVGADIMRKYRSALYFSAKDLRGEETARDMESGWLARHEAAETPLHGVA